MSTRYPSPERDAVLGTLPPGKVPDLDRDLIAKLPHGTRLGTVPELEEITGLGRRVLRRKLRARAERGLIEHRGRLEGWYVVRG